jgi:geranylgeranyl diphosphate synthase type I
VSLAEYEAMIGGKTAALLGASASIGAIAGGADDATAERLGSCSQLLGLAFQAQDDVLGIWGDPMQTGKSSSDDIRTRKKSLPVVWAFERAPKPAAELDRLYSGQLDEAAVERVVALLDEAGARQAATDAARQWMEQALRALDDLKLVEQRRREIDALARAFVHRDS